MIYSQNKFEYFICLGGSSFLLYYLGNDICEGYTARQLLFFYCENCDNYDVRVRNRFTSIQLGGEKII